MKALQYIRRPLAFMAWATGIVAAASLTACNDDNHSYSAGEKGPEANVSVFFPSSTSVNYTFTTAEAAKDINLTVKRLNGKGALTVPVSAQLPEGVTAPSSVEFADGQTTTDLTVKCDNAAPKVSHTVRLSFPAENTNPYAEGYTSLELTFAIADWATFAKDCEVDFAPYSLTCDILHLEGTRNFKIPHFMGSDLDFEFTVPKEYCLPWNGYDIRAYEMIPTKHCWLNTDIPGYWYLYDEENEDWPIWYPEEGKVGIAYLQLWQPNDYSYFAPRYESTSNPGTYVGYIQLCTWVNYTDDSADGPYAYIYFDPLYDPQL